MSLFNQETLLKVIILLILFCKIIISSNPFYQYGQNYLRKQSETKRKNEEIRSGYKDLSNQYSKGKMSTEQSIRMAQGMQRFHHGSQVSGSSGLSKEDYEKSQNILRNAPRRHW